MMLRLDRLDPATLPFATLHVARELAEVRMILRLAADHTVTLDRSPYRTTGAAILEHVSAAEARVGHLERRDFDGATRGRGRRRAGAAGG